MLGQKKTAALNQAVSKALGMEMPYMRLCADVDVPHGHAYDDVSQWAKNRDHKGVYVIGHLEYVFAPMTMPDLDGIKTEDFERALYDVHLIEVFEYPVSWNEINRVAPSHEIMAWKVIAQKLEREELPLLKPVFQRSFGPSIAPNAPWRYRGYYIADPSVLQLYDGKEVPKWYKTLTRTARERGKPAKIAVVDGEPKLLF